MMQSYLFNLKTVFVGLIAVSLLSCDDDDAKPNLRTPIDYNLLTPETPYSQLFVDASGNSTVDLSDGNDQA